MLVDGLRSLFPMLHMSRHFHGYLIMAVSMLFMETILPQTAAVKTATDS